LRDSGAEALADLQSGQAFDVLVTDIQLPGLDGYETAQRALQMRPDLPVLGLTAFAMAEDRQKCMDAGMADHITKPVDADVLVRAILRALRHDASTAVHTPAVAGSESVRPEKSPVDWTALQEMLRKPESQVRVLRTFLDTYAGTPSTLRSLLQAADHDGLRRLVHKVHGATGLLCAKDTQQQAKAIETQMAQTLDLPGAELGALADSLASVVAAVEARLNRVAMS
jgi:CheY-like chemotaxis protein